jgi:hypothetical protein
LPLFHKIVSDDVVCYIIANMSKGHYVTVKIGFCAKLQVVGFCAKVVVFMPSVRQYHVSVCAIAQMVRSAITQAVRIRT